MSILDEQQIIARPLEGPRAIDFQSTSARAIHRLLLPISRRVFGFLQKPQPDGHANNYLRHRRIPRDPWNSAMLQYLK